MRGRAEARRGSSVSGGGWPVAAEELNAAPSELLRYTGGKSMWTTFLAFESTTGMKSWETALEAQMGHWRKGKVLTSGWA